MGEGGGGLGIRLQPGPAGMRPGQGSARDCGRLRSLYKVWACVVVRVKAKLERVGRLNSFKSSLGLGTGGRPCESKQAGEVVLHRALCLYKCCRCTATTHTQGPACPLCMLDVAWSRGFLCVGLGRCLRLAKALEQRATCPSSSHCNHHSRAHHPYTQPTLHHHHHRETVYYVLIVGVEGLPGAL